MTAPAHVITINTPFARSSDEPTCCQRFKKTMWRGLVVVANFLYEIAAKVVLFVLLGVAAHLLFPVIALPFYAMAGGIFLTRLVVKILDRYDFTSLNNFKDKVRGFVNNWSYLQIIVFVVALAACFLSPIPGIIIAGLLGCVNGLIIGAEAVKHQREARRKALTDPTIISQNRIISI
jgi:hypothetical protein